MARLLALEWDAREARAVVARTRGKAVAVEQTFVVPLPQGDNASEADVGPILAKVIAERGLGKIDTLVAVGRSSIELRFLSTPPVPPEELPDLVRFQALRQFTTLGEDWPLDFVPLAAGSDGGNNVLAAAISPELVQQIKETGTAAGIHITRLVLRPFAAASLLRKEANDDKCRMMVDLLRDDADLTVLIGPQVIFPRTVRLPSVTDPEALARSVLAESRRTIIAAQNQLGGRRVEEVVIFGDGQHHSVLKDVLAKELVLPVKLVDPFDSVEWAEPLRAQKPENPGTFAPLLGMLLDEADGAAHAIDFLHPRKKPEPASRKKLYAMIGGGLAAALVLLGFVIQWQLWSLDSRIEELKKTRTNQEKLAKTSAKPRADVAKLDQFAAADIIWLDELRLVSEKFPPPEAARVEDWYATANPKGGGKIILNCLADQPATIPVIERTLPDDRHTVFGSGGTYDAEAGDLPWRFREDVAVRVADEELAALAPTPATKGKTKMPSKAAKMVRPATGGRP